jgi:hypothetical protein
MLRKRSREVSLEPEVLEGIEAVFAAVERERAADTWQELLQLAEECFRALPDKLRQVGGLHYFDDRSETSSSCSAKRSTVNIL